MPECRIDSREQLGFLLKNQKEYKKSVIKAKCAQCNTGYHYKIRGSWSRCNICGYSGFTLVS